LFNKNSEKTVQQKLIPDDNYSISIYLDNVSVNVHFIIAEENEIILPASIQLIEIGNNKMEYGGCDFIAYDKVISPELNEKVLSDTKKIIIALRKLGYRGVGGIDFIVTKDNVYFMEINPRYQSSTNVLNLAMAENNLPTVNELDYIAFNEKSLPKLRPFKVEYSKKCLFNGQADDSLESNEIILKDGYSQQEQLDNEVYLYTLLSKQSLFLNKR